MGHASHNVVGLLVSPGFVVYLGVFQGSTGHLAAVPLGSGFAIKCSEKLGPFIMVNPVPKSGEEMVIAPNRI